MSYSIDTGIDTGGTPELDDLARAAVERCDDQMHLVLQLIDSYDERTAVVSALAAHFFVMAVISADLELEDSGQRGKLDFKRLTKTLAKELTAICLAQEKSLTQLMREEAKR